MKIRQPSELNVDKKLSYMKNTKNFVNDMINVFLSTAHNFDHSDFLISWWHKFIIISSFQWPKVYKDVLLMNLYMIICIILKRPFWWWIIWNTYPNELGETKFVINNQKKKKDILSKYVNRPTPISRWELFNFYYFIYNGYKLAWTFTIKIYLTNLF